MTSIDIDQALENRDVRKAVEAAGEFKIDAPKEKQGPSYKKYPDARIPVSKHIGPLWKARFEVAKKRRKKYEEKWQAALRYFLNDQMGHRTDNDIEAGQNEQQLTQMNDMWAVTENLVFSNIKTMLPATYAKNPRVEFTALSEDPGDDEFAQRCERLVNSILQTAYAPGINLKPKARRATIQAAIMNEGWIKIGWVETDLGVGNVNEDLSRIASELENAKSKDKIKELEGQLLAIEKHTDVLRRQGLEALCRSPFDIYYDSNTTQPDLSDTTWMIERDMLPTEYVKARFLKEVNKDEFAPMYKPTHVLARSSEAGDSEDDITSMLSNYRLVDDDERNHGAYGYEDRDAFERSSMTEVYWVWDSITRRVYLFHKDFWAWPLWVWDDPYQLIEFFPYYRLSFYDNPDSTYGVGEVTYMLDQQDVINRINTSVYRALVWLQRKVIFNIDAFDNVEQFTDFLNNDKREALGVSLPDGIDSVNKLFESVLPPDIAKASELFNKTDWYQQVDRISGVPLAMRQTEFKTNTTNKAIEAYNSSSQFIIDEKIDAIEEFIGRLAYGIAQLVYSRMDQQDVALLIGEQYALDWKNISPQELRSLVNLQVVGGSSEKPTSQMKRQQALEIAQVLGQFASVAPGIITVIIKLFREVFRNDVLIKDEDMDMIMQSMQQAMMRAGSGPGGPSGRSPPPKGNSPGQQRAQQEQGAGRQRAVQALTRNGAQ